MPGIFENVVDLRYVNDIIPGDGHVYLGVAISSACPINIPVRTAGHVAPVRVRLTEAAGVEGLVSHHRPLRMSRDCSIPIKYVSHPLCVSEVENIHLKFKIFLLLLLL